MRLMMRQTPSTPEAYPNSYQCPPGSSCSKVIFPLGPKTASKVSENPKITEILCEKIQNFSVES